jgi:hypothetical protein
MQTDNKEGDSPFDLLSSADKISDEQLLQIFQLFLKFGKESMQEPHFNETREIGAVCAEAIEILSLGAQSSCIDSSVGSFATMLTICQEHVAQSQNLGVPGCFDALLSDTIHRVKTDLAT